MGKTENVFIKKVFCNIKQKWMKHFGIMQERQIRMLICEYNTLDSRLWETGNSQHRRGRKAFLKKHKSREMHKKNREKDEKEKEREKKIRRV